MHRDCDYVQFYLRDCIVEEEIAHYEASQRLSSNQRGISPSMHKRKRYLVRIERREHKSRIQYARNVYHPLHYAPLEDSQKQWSNNAVTNGRSSKPLASKYLLICCDCPSSIPGSGQISRSLAQKFPETVAVDGDETMYVQDCRQD